MAPLHHRIYVVSDLHLGGDLPKPGDPASRGFRICTHVPELAQFIRSIAEKGSQDTVHTELVINGDFTDFLAERWEGSDPWLPFAPDPLLAASRAQIMFERDRPVYDALGEFLERGHSLTVILGNHDVEMSLLPVRREFERVVKATGRSLRYIHDGEAYSVGPVVVEHGNRYDSWNVVNYDSLRRIRSMASRREPLDRLSAPYQPPAGSYMVASVMNAIKERFAFVDLLKPETETVVPLLLTLAPEYRQHLFRVAALIDTASQHGGGMDGIPLVESDISANSSTSAPPSVTGPLERAVGPMVAGDFLRSIEAASPPPIDRGISLEGDISSGRMRSLWEGLKLLSVSRSAPLSSRLPALLTSLQAFRDESSFDPLHERPAYWEVAKSFFTRGFELVVFGHTHFAKHITGPSHRGLYINTGTWSDSIRFPYELLDLPRDQALAALREFALDLEHNRLSSYLSFNPTYATIDLHENTLVKACLSTFLPGKPLEL